MSRPSTLVLVPWHNRDVRDAFLDAWRIDENDPRLLLREDVNRIGCGAMKTAMLEEAVALGALTTIILDSDVHPDWAAGYGSLDEFIALHEAALEDQVIDDFLVPMTAPIARGIPMLPENRSLRVPIAASLGFWTGIPDYSAAAQLVLGATSPMAHYDRSVVFGRPTMLCGMNIAFSPAQWLPWCRFIEVDRLDDVFLSWLWCKEAARRGYGFNFGGPDVKHVRQSNALKSLVAEAKYAEWNETGWREIWQSPSTDYAELRALLPVP